MPDEPNDKPNNDQNNKPTRPRSFRYRSSRPRIGRVNRINEYTEEGKPDLPPVTVNYLKFGVGKGNRNVALRNACHQCRDSGRVGDVWRGLLKTRAMADGLSEQEARKTIDSCMVVSEAREPCGRKSGVPGRKKPIIGRAKPASDETREPDHDPFDGVLYPDKLAGHEGMVAFLKSTYEEGEFVSLSSADEELNPTSGVTLERDALIARLVERKERKHGGDIRDLMSTDRGVFIRMNPMTKGGTKDADVTALRHVLAEIDDDTISRQVQLDTFSKSALPISCIIDSAGRGLHAWVRVDASTRSEYDERAQLVYEALDNTGVDIKVGNPSRWSRCPTAARGDGIQRLVRLRMGCADWEGWFSENDPELERILETGRGPLELARTPIDESMTLLGDRFLCRGGAMMWTGSTGIGKSSSSTQAHILWALGRPAFGITPNGPLKTAVFQVENDDGDLTEMAQGVFKGLGLTEAEKEQVQRNVRTFTVETLGVGVLNLARRLGMGYKGWKPDIVCLDPLQALSGLDVAGDVRGVLEFTMDMTRLARELALGWQLCHHTPKVGVNAIQERGLAYSSYLGAGGAQLANWARADMLLLPTVTEGLYQLIAGKRAGRLGWDSQVRHFKHGKVGICWEDATPEDIKELKEATEQAAPKRRDRSAAPKSKSRYSLNREKGENEFLQAIRDFHKEHERLPSRREAARFGIKGQPRKNEKIAEFINRVANELAPKTEEESSDELPF